VDQVLLAQLAMKAVLVLLAQLGLSDQKVLLVLLAQLV
jgi:hypothetical protein